MELGLSEAQRMFEEALQRYLQEAVPLDRLRRHEAAAAPFDPGLWQGLVDLGLPGLLVPEAHGGSGLGLLEAGLAAERLGAWAAPVPYTGCAVMAVRALLQTSTGQQGDWLPRMASGAVRMAVGFDATLSGQTGRSSLHRDGEQLSGCIDALLEADGATHLLLFGADGGAAIVQAAHARVQPRNSVDATRRVATVALDRAPAVRLAFATADPHQLATQVLDAGRLVLACDTLGAAQTMLDRSVAYAKEREQFGRPIGSFQGVKYMLADMVTQLEPCRALVWHAAMLADTGSPQARVAALQAKAHVSDVAREVARMAVEVHGGVGFTDLLGLPFWFRRIALNRQLLGSPQRCRDEAAVAQGWA